MPKEFEAKFLNIDVAAMKKKLREIHATKVHDPMKYYRLIFKRCEESGDKPGFVRIRDEGNKVTMTTKMFNNKKFPEEHEVTIHDSFEKGCEFLKAIGIQEKSYQETIRQKWSHPLAHEITIDIIPGLPVYMEVDCVSEKKLNQLISLLGLNREDMRYGSFDKTYTEYYDIPHSTIINKTPKLTFKDVGSQIKPNKNNELFHDIIQLHKYIDERKMNTFYKKYTQIYNNHLSSRKNKQSITLSRKKRKTIRKKHKTTNKRRTKRNRK